MAYATYITEALVCGMYDSRNADRSFLLFTREAGMVYAHARSVREERSKQRYALQECSHARITLIRGKSGWKIAGTEPIQNLYTVAESRESRAFLRNVILLLKRVVHGETVNEKIFDDVVESCVYATLHASPTLEHILSLRILHALGYIAPVPEFSAVLHCPMLDTYTVRFTESEERKCREAIVHALIQSQL